MGKKEKLIKKLRSNPKDFTFLEAETLFGYFDYHRDDKGKTSGSRVRFFNDARNAGITIHRPHPQNDLKDYQVKEILEHLEEEGLI